MPPQSTNLIFSRAERPVGTQGALQPYLIEKVRSLAGPAWLVVMTSGTISGASGLRAHERILETISSAFRVSMSDTNGKVADQLRDALDAANSQAHHVPIRSAELDRQTVELVALSIQGRELAIARVGQCYGYLVRDMRATPLTDVNLTSNPRESGLRRRHAVGADARLVVDLAECRVHPGDLVILCTHDIGGSFVDANLKQLAERPDRAAHLVVAQSGDRAHPRLAAVGVFVSPVPAQRVRVVGISQTALAFVILMLAAAIATFATLWLLNEQILGPPPIRPAG